MKINRLNDLNIINQEKEKHLPFLENGIKELDIYYLINKLRFSCELLSREKILNQKFEYPYLDFLVKEIENNQSYYQKIPAIFIYFNIYKLLKEEKNEQYYKQVILLLDKEYQKFTKSELREIYSYILNYLIVQFNLGKTSFLNELFNIYQQMIKNR